MYNYACFVYIKPPKQTAKDDQMNSEKEGGSDDGMNLFEENEYKYLDLLFEADDDKTPETDNESDKTPEETPEPDKKEDKPEEIEDTVYFLSAAFDDNKPKEKLDVLGDFIDSVNSMAL